MVFGEVNCFNIHNLQINLSHSINHVYLRSRMKWRPMQNLSVVLQRRKWLLSAILCPNPSLVQKLYFFNNLDRTMLEQDERQMETRSTSNCYPRCKVTYHY